MFIIELVPPSSRDMLEGYASSICNLLPSCTSFSIASKPSQGISGFEKSVNLVRALRDLQIPELDIIFHITCRDFNRDNIEAKLQQLHQLKIGKLLVVTGDDYKPAERGTGSYDDSLDLLPDVVRYSHKWFQWIAVGGYPGGNGRQTHDNAGECERLLGKIKLGANVVMTQCVFEAESFNEFSRMIRARHHDIKIIPSVALFSNPSGLDKIICLTRVNDLGSAKLSEHLKSLEDFRVEAYCKEFSTKLCHELTGYAKIALCPFGRLDLAKLLIQQLYPPHRTL